MATLTDRESITITDTLAYANIFPLLGGGEHIYFPLRRTILFFMQRFPGHQWSNQGGHHWSLGEDVCGHLLEQEMCSVQ
jgi:hypothetical protein